MPGQKIRYRLLLNAGLDDVAEVLDIGQISGSDHPSKNTKKELLIMELVRICFALMAFLLLIGSVCAGNSEEDGKLDRFFDDYLERLFQLRPVEATYLGDHRFDDQLDDLRAEALAKFDEFLRDTLERLPQGVDYSKLSRDHQIDYEIFEHELRKRLWLSEHFDPFVNDPRSYNTYISDSVFLLLTQSTLPKPRNLRNAARRIQAIPRIVDAAQANLQNPPKSLTEVAIRQNRGAIAFYEKGIFEIAGETPGLGELAEPCQQAVKSLKEYQAFLEEQLLPNAKGEWRIGKAQFVQKLAYELNLDQPADEVFASAQAEAKRVRQEMAVIARQLWSRFYPKQPLPPDDPNGQQQLIATVLDRLDQEHGKVEALVQDANATVSKLKQFIQSESILTLPEPDRCQLIEMPEFQRGFSVAYLNPAPALDPKANSFYAISPPPSDWDANRVESFLREYNSYMLQILSIHEAYPGHYVQLDYGNRHPSKIRRVLSSGVFAEGWAVYTEQMMLDQGYGEGDLGLRLQQLKFYLRAVVNAILDHRMHCQEMSDEEAYELLTRVAFQTEGEALGKIQRAKQSSCQLSTYFVGRMAFYQLRQTIQREMGDRFDLGKYHEAVLSHGTLPVKYLPELTRRSLHKR